MFITKAKLPGNMSRKKIASLDLPEGGSSRYLEDGYKFYLENLNLEILESKKEHEGWYTMTLEGEDSVQHFCLQLKLYGKNGCSPHWRAMLVPCLRTKASLRGKE